MLFYVFWEAMLIPMFLLIGIWGGPRRIYASVKFFLYTLAGSLLMLAAALAVYWHHGARTGIYTFDLVQLTQLSYPPELQLWAFLGFFAAFAIKVPLVPFHTWLPDAHVEAPTAGSVVLAGVLLKMGTYGLMRFSLPLFPDASRHLAPFVLTLAVIGIIYGAVLALAQDDLKKLIAYSSISHLGLRRRRHLLLRPARRGRRGAPDDRPRPDHRRALPLRRHDLRAHAPALDPEARRAGAPAAGLRDAAGVLLARLARAARAGRASSASS